VVSSPVKANGSDAEGGESGKTGKKKASFNNAQEELGLQSCETLLLARSATQRMINLVHLDGQNHQEK